MNAVDFLLAPFSQEGVHRAIERVRRQLLKLQPSGRVQGLTDGVYALPRRSQPDRLAVRNEGRIVFVDVDEIDWIAAAANYVRINTGRESFLMREGIGGLSERLDRKRFIRIHRSTIVNIHKIKELQRCSYGDYIVILRNGKELSCGHGFRNELDRFVSECT
jgi:two-component system LytT family response regulator